MEIFFMLYFFGALTEPLFITVFYSIAQNGRHEHSYKPVKVYRFITIFSTMKSLTLIYRKSAQRRTHQRRRNILIYYQVTIFVFIFQKSKWVAVLNRVIEWAEPWYSKFTFERFHLELSRMFLNTETCKGSVMNLNNECFNFVYEKSLSIIVWYESNATATVGYSGCCCGEDASHRCRQ